MPGPRVPADRSGYAHEGPRKRAPERGRGSRFRRIDPLDIFSDATIRRLFGTAEPVRPSGFVVESRLPSQRPRPSPASGSEGPRRVGGRLPSSPGSNATRSSRPPLGGRPRPNFKCRGLLGGKEAPELFKRSEEHTSELQSQSNLVCRLLLDKKHNPVHYTSV